MGVNEQTTLNAAGQLTTVVRIHLVTTLGASGTIDVPLAQYEALTGTDEGRAILRERLEEKSDQLDAPFSM
jgi:hypothetical protein